MKKLRFIRKLIAILIRDRVHHPARLAAETVLLIARCGVLLLLYHHVFGLRGGTIGGIDYRTAAWSMFLYSAFSALRLREVAFAMMGDVRSGHIEVLLGKPVHYVPYRLWWQLGAGLYPACAISLVGGTMLITAVGLPETMRTSTFLPGLLATIIGGSALSLLLYALVGLMSFWIEDIGPVYWLVDKSVMVLGGSYLPVALFPPLMKDLAAYSPFGASQFITQTVGPAWTSDWPRLLTLQLLWIALLTGAVWLLYGRARNKVSINGG